MVFDVLDEVNVGKNTSLLVNLLKSEGIEVLSLETRMLDVQEAMYLSIRQLQFKEMEIDKYL